jgi:hypothetical protein
MCSIAEKLRRDCLGGGGGSQPWDIVATREGDNDSNSFVAKFANNPQERGNNPLKILPTELITFGAS